MKITSLGFYKTLLTLKLLILLNFFLPDLSALLFVLLKTIFYKLPIHIFNGALAIYFDIMIYIDNFQTIF